MISSVARSIPAAGASSTSGCSSKSASTDLHSSIRRSRSSPGSPRTVTRIVEKPAPGTEPSNLINAGTYVLEPSVLDRVESGRKVSIEREVFPASMVAGRFSFGPAELFQPDDPQQRQAPQVSF